MVDTGEEGASRQHGTPQCRADAALEDGDCWLGRVSTRKLLVVQA